MSDSLQSWTVVHQTSLSMGFSRQEYWSGFPFPFPGSLPDPGIKPKSPRSPALAGGFITTEPPGKPLFHSVLEINSAEIEFPSQLKILKKTKQNCVTSYRDPGISKAFDLEQKAGNSKERKNLFLQVSAFYFLAPMLEGGITVCMMVQREIGSTIYLQF